MLRRALGTPTRRRTRSVVVLTAVSLLVGTLASVERGTAAAAVPSLVEPPAAALPGVGGVDGQVARPPYEVAARPPVATPKWRTELPTGFDARFSKRLDALTTETFERYWNVDGSITDVVADGPARFQTVDGVWHQIDLSPVGLADGTLRPRSAEHVTTLALDGTQPIQTLATDAGDVTVRETSITAAPTGLASLVATLTEDTASIAASGGRLVRYRFLSDGMKEDIVVPTALQGTFDVTFDLPSGVTARQGEDHIEFVDGAGKVVGGYGGGMALDAVAMASDRAPVGTYTPVLVDLSGPTTARVHVDDDWLRAPTRAFPVTFDPILRRTFSPGQGDIYLNSDNPTSTTSNDGAETGTAYVAQDHLRLGRKVPSLGNGTVMLIPVPNGLPTSPPSGYTYTSSSLRLWGYSGSSTPCPGTAQVKVINGSWNPQTITWAGYEDDPSNPSDPFLAVSGSTDGTQGLNNGYHQWLALSTTNAVADRFDGTPGSFQGLLVQPQNQTDSCAWREYRSADYGTGIPQLLITYTASTPQTPPPPPASSSGSIGYRRPPRMIADPVDVVTGNLVSPETDLPSPDSIFGLEWARTYNLFDTTSAAGLGRGWSSSFSPTIAAVTGGVAMTTPDGRQVTWTSNGSAYNRPPDYPADLSVVSGNYRVTFNDGSRWDFDSLGRLVSLTDWAGRAVTVNRNGAGQLTTVVSSQGVQLSFTYGTSGTGAGKIVSVAGPAGTVGYGYDTNGNLTSATDVGGKTTAYAYDGSNRLVSITDPTGVAQFTNTFDAQGRVKTQTQPSGAVTTFTYDGYTSDTDLWSTDVTDSVTGSSGKVSYAFDGAQLVRAITDNLPNPGGGTGNVTAFDYESSLLDMTSTTSRLGGLRTTAYDSSNRALCLAEPGGECPDTLGGITSGTGQYEAFHYDTTGRPDQHYVTGEGTTSSTYTGANRIPSSTTDPAGSTTTYEITNGLVTKETDADGVVTSYSYDSAGRMLTRTDGAGSTTTYAYDSAGRLRCTVEQGGTCPNASGVGGSGSYTTTTYNAAGLVAQERAADGAITSYTYDDAGRVKTITDPTSAVTTNHYDATTGLLTSVDKPGRYVGATLQYNTWHYTYDANGNQTCEAPPGGTCPTGASGTQPYRLTSYGALGRVTSTTNELGQVTTYVYDADGNQSEVHNPDGSVTKSVYDSAGRVIEEIDGSNRSRKTYYDPAGRPSCVAEPTGDCVNGTGPITTTTYDSFGRTATETDAAGGVTRYTYTAAGRQASVVTPTGAIVATAYDAAGRPWKSIDPLGAVTLTAYNLQGRASTVTSPSGLVTSYTYDPGGRQATITDPAGVVTTRTYSLRGEVKTEQVSGQGTATFNYNGDGTVRSVVDALGRTTTYDYDVRGNRTNRTNALSKAESWQYDNANELVAYIDQLNRQTTYTHWNDATNGRKEKIQDPAGKATTTVYNGDGSVQSKAYQGGQTLNYSYDTAGHLDAVADGSSTWDYSFDQAGHLLSTTSPAGRTQRWTWDTAGRRTSMRNPDGTVWHYAYDAAGRLQAITTPNASEIGALVNSSFEAGTDGWQPWYSTTPDPVSSSDSARTGTRSLKVPVNANGATARRSVSSLVSPGQTYTFSAWVNVGDTGLFGEVQFTDAAFASLGSTPLPSVPATTAGQWTQLVVTFTVPAGAAHTNIVIADTDVAWHLDDETLTTTPTATTAPPAYSATYETGTDGWGSWWGTTDPVQTTTQAHSGTGSLKINADGDPNTTRSTGSLTAGSLYTLSAWIKGAANGVWGEVQFYDSSANLLGKLQLPVTTPASGQWARLLVSFKVPAGTTSTKFGLAESDGDPNVWYLDDVNVTPGVGGTPMVVGHRASASGAVTAASSITVNKPTGTAQNDVLVATVVTPPATFAPSPAYQATYESTDEGWGQWYGTVPARSTDVAHTGTWSWKMPSGTGGANTGHWFDPSTFAVGTTYTLSAWVTGSSAAISGQIQYYDSSWTLITQPSISGPTTTLGIWSPLATTFTPPAGAAHICICLQGTATWYLDDVTVTPQSSTSITAPSGWHLALEANPSGAPRVQVWWKAATASEPASYQWNLPAGTTAAAGISAYSGVDTTAPIDAIATRANGSGTSQQADGVVTSATSRLLSTVTAVGAAGPMAPPSTMSEAIDQSAGVGGLGVGLETAYEALLLPGGTANRQTTSSTAAKSTTATLALRPAAQLAAAYTYDTDGRLTSEALADGSRSFGYGTSGTAKGRLTSYGQTLPGANRTTTLGYDSSGRLSSEATGSQTWTYGYDNAGQLTGATPTTGSALGWTYDQLGRRSTATTGATTKTSRYDDANQLCWVVTGTSSNACASAPVGATTYTYDQAGRMLTETASAVDKVTYTYDPAGRINTLQRVSGANTTTQTRSYDPTDDLVGIANTGADTTTATFDWDLTQGVPQLASQVVDGTTTDLAYGADHWAAQLQGGTVAAIGVDVHDSVVPTTNTSGRAQGSDYNPWGVPSGSTTVDPRLGYRGELTLDSLVDLRARQYEPQTGTFTSVDPVDGVNGTTSIGQRYAYANNDPLGHIDPLGLQVQDPQFRGLGPIEVPQTPPRTSRGYVAGFVAAPVATTIELSPGLAALALAVGLIDSWPSAREVNAEIARRTLFSQLDHPERVAKTSGVALHTRSQSCGVKTLRSMLDRSGGGGVMLEALRMARQRENLDGISGAESGQTTAVALYCIDGLAGSTIARQRNAIHSPEGFAQVSNPALGPPLLSTNYHAETNALASITDFVRPRSGWPPAGSSGFVIIMSDRKLCNLCAGYIRRWTGRYPGVAVFAIDPALGRAWIAGRRIK